MIALGHTFLSTQLLTQTATRKTQVDLANAQVELSTQRHGKMLNELEGKAGRNIRWHAEVDSISFSMKANDLHATRGEVAQLSLKKVSELASTFLSDLIGARGAEAGRDIIGAQAKNALSTLRDLLNVDVDGAFLFSGRNQDTLPLEAFHGGAGEADFDARFMAVFGVSKTDPAVETISPTQIDGFLNGNFPAIFASPAWEANISNATNDNVKAFLGQGQSVDVLANVNEGPFRELYAAFIAITEFTRGDLNDASFKKLIDGMATKVSSAVQGLADIQARIGVNQNTLDDANEQLKAKKNWLNEAILKTESVDTYDVASRINALMTQLEASYSVTSRISRISLLNYL
jgi:flagellar hook-associated protein 3 FlgL